MNEEFWQNKIKAFLHDPPDKALILGTFESHERAASKLWRLIGLKDDAKHLADSGLKELFPGIHNADIIASTMQRLNLPKNLRKFGIYFTKEPKDALIKHTISGKVATSLEGKESFLTHLITTYGYKNLRADKWAGGEVIKFLKELDKEGWKKKYFLLWRFLPEKYSLGYLLPADTRIPDHSIWDHLDVTAAISSCLSGGLALLAVKLLAVQEFITHSRKLADLWAASHIYSTIIFAGIKALVEEYGPDVVIYPQLRGNPMVDLEEFNGSIGKFKLLDYVKDKEKVKECLKVANFPNTFLCFIPFLKAEGISKRVENAIKQKWRDITNKAREILRRIGMKVDERLWNAQIENAIEITSAWLEFFNFNRFNNVKVEIPEDLKKKQQDWLRFIEEAERRSNYGHFYSLTYELLGIILAQKSRFWKAWEERPVTGKKCLMCGRRNALVERSLDGKIYRYWNDEKWEDNLAEKLGDFRHFLKEGERLCAVCLTKRLYGFRAKSVFEEIFGKGFKPPEQESVVEIAARDFIENIKDDEDFKLLKDVDIELIYEHEWESDEKMKTSIKQLEEKKEGIENKLRRWWKAFDKPNKYYAVLMMDGDRIGKMLSGETLPEFGEFLHPRFKKVIEEWKENGKDKGRELIKMKRVLTPSHHIAISRAMKDFSLYVVPKIVEKYKGFLVYAGGDDVLALFPADKVLDAAYEIQEFFKKDFYEIDGRKIMGLGSKASMSAGIVFVHYKWPLYDALEKVREAEKRAKNRYGRNAFCMTFIKRSGEILTAGGKWEFKEFFDRVINVLSPKEEEKRKLSHRFIYDLIDIIGHLKKEDDKWEEPFINILEAEIKRLLKRRNYKDRLTKEEIEKLHEEVFCNLIRKYLEKSLPLEDIGILLKIIYDAYRGEEG